MSLLKKDGIILIGEIGINHNGDIQIVKKLIDSVFVCGWDCVKFQKRTPDLCIPEEQKGILKDTPWGIMPYLEYKKRLEFSLYLYYIIDNYCTMKPIPWTASVWDVPSLDFISGFDTPFIKIPSAKITDLELIQKACLDGNFIMLSTGMSTLYEIDRAVEVIEDILPKESYVLMHTNSTYPTPIKDINLNMIRTLQDRYGCEVGYSSHDDSLEPCIAAVALGAKIIEKHITINHNLWGTDQKASLEPHGMWMLRKRIDEAYLALGDGRKIITPNEMEVRKKLNGN